MIVANRGVSFNTSADACTEESKTKRKLSITTTLQHDIPPPKRVKTDEIINSDDDFDIPIEDIEESDETIHHPLDSNMQYSSNSKTEFDQSKEPEVIEIDDDFDDFDDVLNQIDVDAFDREVNEKSNSNHQFTRRYI